MKLEERLESISEWGNRIASLTDQDLDSLFVKAGNKNRWFTNENCSNALQGIFPWLQLDVLKRWADQYAIPNDSSSKSIGLVMAGNIPLVGFHDFLCVLVNGHTARVKLSFLDDELLTYLANILVGVDERWKQHFSFEDRLNNVAAVIATGSDNSARYFEYYFRHIPKIIRKNRTSVGVIMGEENPEEIKELGKDVFTYFGLGCRNVSKVFVPDNFNLGVLIKSFESYRDIINHNKYGNNYDYQKAIRLVSGKKFIDGEFVILEYSTELVSPIALLYYEYYSNLNELSEKLKRNENKIQCIVSAKGLWKGSVPFGQAQNPAIGDYADGVDTMNFLAEC